MALDSDSYSFEPKMLKTGGHPSVQLTMYSSMPWPTACASQLHSDGLRYDDRPAMERSTDFAAHARVAEAQSMSDYYLSPAFRISEMMFGHSVPQAL